MDTVGTAEPAHEREKKHYATMLERNAMRNTRLTESPLRTVRHSGEHAERCGHLPGPAGRPSAPLSALRTGPRARHRARKPTGEDDTATSRRTRPSHRADPDAAVNREAARPSTHIYDNGRRI